MSFVDETFGPDGHLARAFPGYETRESQLALSKAIEKAIAEGASLLGEGPTGCHIAGQGILLFDGRVKKVEDVIVGDLLVGPDGTPRTVLALARGRQETATIRPIKGDPWTVNLDHVLTLVRTGSIGKRQTSLTPNRIVDVTVREWLGWSKTRRHLHKLFRAPARFAQRRSDLVSSGMLDPYFLGIVLGDGTLANDDGVCVTKPDPEIRAACEEQAARWGLRVRTDVGMDHNIVGAVGNKHHPILEQLRALKLMPIESGNRFVPAIYKTATIEERRQILAGLLDTDGSAVNGCYDFISKSRQLAADVVFLARSVGLAAYARPCAKSCPGTIGVYHRVSISGAMQGLPLRIARKKIRDRTQKKDPLRVGFRVDVTGKVEPYFGFKLDGDGRYLLDDFTVTHNSGKSVAYLVPAIEHAVKTGSRALVVTANIVLQEQIVNKDLPMLRATLPLRFDFGLAKGRSNYLCLETLDDATAERALMGGRAGEEGLDAVIEWASRTEAGDLSELPFEPKPALRRLFTISSEDCLGSSCPRKDDCFPNRARARLQQAQIVVANYHLFFSDMQVRAMSDGEARILPDFDVLILDEAHRCADIARDFFGFRITPGSVRWAARLLSGSPGKGGRGETPEIDEELKGRLGRAADRFFDELREHARSEEYKARLRRANVARHEEICALLKQAAERYEQAASIGELDAAGRKKLRNASSRCFAIEIAIGLAMNPDATRGAALFVETDEGSSRVALCSKQIDVSKRLRESVFESPSIRSTIATSATLTTGEPSRSDAFDFVIDETGATAARTLAVPSPFDFAGRALLVVPEEFDVCLPNERKYAEQCARLFAQICRLAGGRTLGLFTTRRAMDLAYDVANDEVGRLDTLGLVVMKQGQAPRSELVRRFREDVSSVLIGTASFWEGVDVQGEALSCVAIDKLPFPPPDDPVLDALDARDKDAFANHMLPRALIAFKQGFGRLIRTKTDRGVVVCFDRRIVEKGYGKKFLNSLPPGVRVSRRLEDVRDFLDGTFEPEPAYVTSTRRDERRLASSGETGGDRSSIGDRIVRRVRGR